MFSVLDLTIIIVFLFLSILLGFIGKTQRKDLLGYVLAGRGLSLPAFTLSLFSTWYGGILGVGEFVYHYGISAWVIQGIPYYVFSVLFAFFMSEKIRKTQVLSLPDLLEQSFGRPMAVWSSLLTFILSSPAPYLLMMGVLIQSVFGVGLFLSIFFTVIISCAYLFWRGFAADVATDIYLGVFMFLSFFCFAVFLLTQGPVFALVLNALPENHLTWNGGQSFQFVLVWVLVALWTFVDPSFYHRCLAAKNAAVAKKGILISVVLWFCFDMCTLTAGLYARHMLPNLDNALFAFPELGHLMLGSGYKGLFFVGMFATIITTLSSVSFVSAISLGKDFYSRLKKLRSEPQIQRSIQISLFVSLFLGIWMAVEMPSVVGLWYTLASLTVPGLLLPLLCALFQKDWISPSRMIAVSGASVFVSTCWFFWGQFHTLEGYAQYPLGIEPMIPGLVVSFLICLLGFLRKTKYDV